MNSISNDFVPIESVESQWRLEELDNHLNENYLIDGNFKELISSDKTLIPEKIAELITVQAMDRYQSKYLKIKDNVDQLEKQVMLQVLDVHWKDHLAEMDHLRQSVGLRAYAQKNPKNEYKREAFEMFEVMLAEINTEAVKILFRLELASEKELRELEKRAVEAQKNKELKLKKDEAESLIGNNTGSDTSNTQNPETRTHPKIGRNEPCPCGSGKKFKVCHGK